MTEKRGIEHGAGSAINAFLQLVLEDRNQGQSRSLADYQSRFPGQETLIAEEHARIFGKLEDASTTGSAFRSAYAEDRRLGCDRTLQEYVALFPGADLEIAQTFASQLVEATLAAAEEFTPGSRVGPYRIDRVLGRGGQGVVYAAQDTRLGRTVALKLLTGIGAASPERLRRFQREASIAALLDHPGICTVYEWASHQGVAVRGDALLGGTNAECPVVRATTWAAFESECT